MDKARESDNTTALFIATQNGRLETAKYLLERGADPNTYFMPNKITCFVKACFEGRVEIAKEMLKTGKVNLRVLNYRNNNVLQLCTACLENRYDSVVLLLEQKEILDMINDNTEGFLSFSFIYFIVTFINPFYTDWSIVTYCYLHKLMQVSSY